MRSELFVLYGSSSVKIVTRKGCRMIPSWPFTLIVLGMSVLTSGGTGADANGVREISVIERQSLVAMGLPEDATDAQVMECLGTPEKFILATAVVRYRRMSSAIPKLLQIVTDDDAVVLLRIAAAEALCDFQNKDWMPIMREISVDPNAALDIPLKIDVAGLLARGGDYSQFEYVGRHVADENDSVRYTAIRSLAKFADANDPVAEAAVDLALYAATSDTQAWLRQLAIGSLEQMAKKRPRTTAKLITALEANVNSSDARLRTTCVVGLKSHTGVPAPTR